MSRILLSRGLEGQLASAGEEQREEQRGIGAEFKAATLADSVPWAEQASWLRRMGLWDEGAGEWAMRKRYARLGLLKFGDIVSEE